MVGGAQLLSALDDPVFADAGGDQRTAPPTFVLVPGAWCGGWVWNHVATLLETRGYRAFAPTMPGLSPGEDPAGVHLSDATNALVTFIENRDLRNVVLVAHDWSGYPVTAAANRLGRRVQSVVYWSAFVPLAGESMIDAIPYSDAAALTGAAKAAGGDKVMVPYPRWQNRFVQTAIEEIRQLTYGHLRPEPWSYLTDSLKRSEAALPDVPVTYLVSAQDLSLPVGPEWWADKYAARLGVEAVSFDAPHSAYFTDPVLLTDNLVSAATAARS